MQVLRKFYGVKGSWSFYYWSVRMTYLVTDKAKWRAKVVTFFEKYGLEATEEAFSVKKSSIYKWRKLLKDNQGRLEVLNDKSKVSKLKRKPNWDPRIVNFIKDLREQYPRLGKAKIKPFLDEFCLKNNLKTISESTIYRIITNKKFFFHPRKITHYGKIVKTEYRKKLRRKGYQPEYPEDLLQIDSITRFKDGLKRYILTAIDCEGEFSFAYSYSSLSSKSAQDFFKKLESVFPFKIKAVQTDNGLEFEKYFRDELEKRGITHFWNYPKHFQMNAKTERFNRTLQEEFLDYHTHLFYDLNELNQKLMEWLLFYNTQRLHYSTTKIHY
uniref:Integrase catalytic domain-containing protein n=1 Tax=Dictyoglomus turgidum TaxID=513050 RepID=A0A7C3SML4_9BACT